MAGLRLSVVRRPRPLAVELAGKGTKPAFSRSEGGTL